MISHLKDLPASSTVRKVVGPTILLYSGNYFDLLEPENSVFTIEDVAHGLSHTCRFAGQCIRFYSVAEHLVHASYFVPAEHAYPTFMHDTPEAFIGDMSKPLKDLLPDYRAIEKGVEAAVFTRFNVPQPLPPCVKEVDIRMLVTEQRQLMRNNDGWSYTRGHEPLPIEIPGWSPAEARERFLKRFYELAPATVRFA